MQETQNEDEEHVGKISLKHEQNKSLCNKEKQKILQLQISILKGHLILWRHINWLEMNHIKQFDDCPFFQNPTKKHPHWIPKLIKMHGFCCVYQTLMKPKDNIFRCKLWVDWPIRMESSPIKKEIDLRTNDFTVELLCNFGSVCLY